MSGQDRVPKPPRNAAGRPLDPDQEVAVGGGPRHMASGPGSAADQWTIHRLLSIATRLNELRLNRRLAKLGLTTSALDALETAAALEPTTVTDLAASLCVSRQSMGKVVRRLQSLGFLTKERGRDGRSADIHLTPQGRDVLFTAENLVHEEPEAKPADEVLFRRELEQHIHRLRNAERSTTTRHPATDRKPHPTRGSGHGQDPLTTNLNTTGATIWRQPTGTPDPKQPSKKQPRQ